MAKRQKRKSGVCGVCNSEISQDDNNECSTCYYTKCTKLPIFKNDCGIYWIPLALSQIEPSECKRAALEMNNNRWEWKENGPDAWEQEFKNSLFAKTRATNDDTQYGIRHYWCADRNNTKIMFILIKSSCATAHKRWNEIWESELVFMQAWMSCNVPDRTWQWVIRDATLVQFCCDEQQSYPKFGPCFRDARKMCLRKIMEHPNHDVFLQHLQDTFYLCGLQSSNHLVGRNEAKWNEILPDGFFANEEEKNNSSFVLAFALITIKKTEDGKVQYIELELIESHVPHAGVAQRLIYLLKQRFEVPIFPNDIQHAFPYWEKNFNFILHECISIAKADYYKFGNEHIVGFGELFERIFLKSHTEPT